MNKTAIKNFAIRARVQLIEAVKQRAYEYEITEDGENKSGVETIGGRLLSNEEKEQRRQLIEQIRKKGYAQVMEEAAYTWFNRFIALRFMEVNGYLPSKIRVFTDENGAFDPRILKEAVSAPLDGLDRGKVLDLLDKQNNEELYKYLLITQCNALKSGLPYMFEKIDNWTELLFPANLLRSDSVIGRMISEIPEKYWTDQVQIIGWLYQYYNSELKDETFALLKKNVKITKERIPAATQLFTPEWIVRYMVENSLGRIYIDKRKNEGIYGDGIGYGDSEKLCEIDEERRIHVEKELAEQMGWKYYLPEAKQKLEVRKQLDEIQRDYNDLKIKDIKVIDPCMGSGHILVYAFDVLMQIYIARGYNPRDAAQSILENNLYGLDIDDRAAQLAYFAVMMKARQYDRSIFSRGIQPRVYSIVESNGLDSTTVDYFTNNDPKLKKDFETLVGELHDAKEYGSILNISQVDFSALYARIDEVRDDISIFREIILNCILPLIQVAEVMAQKYDVVVTNPPYMAVSNAGAKVQDYVKKYYPDSKADLFAVFMERCGEFIKRNGYQAMITQHSWMFLSSFENLRAKLQSVDIINMAHLGARAFEEIGGDVVQTTSFVLRRTHTKGYKGTYCRLIEPTTQQGKEDMFLVGENRYTAQQNSFSKIPGSPVAYWVSKEILSAFEGTKLGDIAKPRQGLATGNNDRFLRFWHEVSLNKIGFGIKDRTEAAECKKRWFPCNKGGEYRKWYGNNDFIVNWENDGFEIRNNVDDKGKVKSRPQNVDYYFKEGMTWSTLSSGSLGMRYSPQGHMFETKGSVCFANDKEELPYLLALMNSEIVNNVMSFISPTMDYHEGPLGKVPVKRNDIYMSQVTKLSNDNVSISKKDWDSFETSWDFKKNPLV